MEKQMVEKQMNSKILESIGLGNIDIAIPLIILLVIGITAIVYCILVSKKLKKLTCKYEKFMSGNDGESLEKVFEKRFDEIDFLLKDNKNKEKSINAIVDNMQITVQKIGIVKYDAFSEMGGKLSFALVMLDKCNNGFVINSMHSREGCYTYIKEIINGESFIALGDEEQEALNKALGK